MNELIVVIVEKYRIEPSKRQEFTK